LDNKIHITLLDDANNEIQRILDSDNLLWLYLGDSWPIYNTLYKLLGKYAAEITPGPLLNSIAGNIRREFLDSDKFHFKNSEKLHWITTNTAEKNPINSSLFVDICKILICREIFKKIKDDILIIVDDAVLGCYINKMAISMDLNEENIYPSEKIKEQSFVLDTLCLQKKGDCNSNLELVNNFCLKLKEICEFWKKLRGSRQNYDLGSNIDILIGVWGNLETFKKGNIKKTDFIYGRFPEYLNKRNLNTAYFVMPMNWRYSISDLLIQFSQAKDRVITVYDCIENIDKFYELALSCINTDLILTNKYEISGFDFSELIKIRFTQEKANGNQLWALMYNYVGKYFFDNKIKISNILFSYENQPWEKALRHGFRKYMPRTKIIQYASAPIEDYWLSAYPSQADIDTGNMPDVLATHSKYSYCRFIKNGFKETELRIWPAFRHQEFLEAIDHNKRVLNINCLNILLVGNTSEQSTIELLVKLITACRDINDVNIRVRLHPRAGQPKEIIKIVSQLCNVSVLPQNVKLSNNSTLVEELKWSNLVSMSGTGVEMEALACGCKTMYVKSDCNLDMSVLDHKKHDYIVRGIKEIKKIVVQCISEIKNQTNKSYIKKLDRHYYYEPITFAGVQNALNSFGI